MKINFQLRRLMQAQGITAAELARTSGVSKQSISDWLAGVKPSSLSRLVQVAAALEVSLDELVLGDSAAPIGMGVGKLGQVGMNLSEIAHSKCGLLRAAGPESKCPIEGTLEISARFMVAGGKSGPRRKARKPSP